MTDLSKTAMRCAIAFLASGLVGWAVVSKRSAGEIDAPRNRSVTAPLGAKPQQQAIPDLLVLDESELLRTLDNLTSTQIRRTIRSLTTGNLSDVHRQSVLQSALEALAVKDPVHFLCWIDTADVPLGLSTSAVEIAASLLAQGGSEEGFVTIQAMSSMRIRRVAILAYGAALAHRAPKIAARQMIEAGAGFDVGTTVGAVWAAQDPMAAASFFAELSGENTLASQQGLQTTMEEWAQQDPDGALAWTKTCQDLFARRLATNYLLYSLAADPDNADTALHFISELPLGSLRDQMMFHLGWNLAKHETVDETLLAKAIEIGSPFENAKLLGDLTGKVPTDLAKEIIHSISGQSHRESAIKHAVTSITDQETGQQFIESFESPGDRIAVRSALFSLFFRKDPGEAVQLAFEAEYPREQTQLLSALAKKLMPTKESVSPLTDYSWIPDLDPNQRQAVKLAVDEWANQQEFKLPANLKRAFD